MGYRGSRLRRAGLLLLALGLGSAAVLFVAFAWFARENASRFSEFVSWANIVSVPLSMVGIVLTLTGKYVSQANPSAELLAATADDVAREALRQDGFLRADLLSTDVPDARLAGACFQAGKSSPTRKSGKKQPAPDVRRFDEITGYFTRESGHRLVILGDSGSGKTVLAVTLTVGLLEQRSAAPAEERQRTPVPCLLHLPSWNAEAADLEEWLRAQVANRFRLDRKVAGRLVRGGLVLPVLDGLDEMDLQDEPPRRSEAAVSRINDYIARTRPMPGIVVICRSGDRYYERLARKVSAPKITVQNLSPEQIIGYITLQCEHESIVPWQPLIEAVRRDGKSSTIVPQLNRPWRLVAAVAYGRSADPADLLPTSEEASRSAPRAQYADRVGKLLMNAAIQTRISAHGKHRTDAATVTQQLRIVATLLARMESSGRGTGTEIVLHEWCQAFPDRQVRRAQFYTMTALMQLSFSVFQFLPFPAAQENLTWLLAFIANYLLIHLFCLIAARLRTHPAAIRLTILFTPVRAASLGIGIVISAAVGWTGAAGLGVLYGIGVGATSAALYLLIIASTGLDIADATRPAATLVNDRNVAVVTGVAAGAFATMYFAVVFGLATGIALSSMCLIGAVFSSSYARYLAAAYLGKTRGLPLRFARFLDWCQSAGIMRISGAGYQFRHKELLDYLLAK